MIPIRRINDPLQFSQILFELMQKVNAGIGEMELYEFRYALDEYAPENQDWPRIELKEIQQIQNLITSRDFFDRIQIRKQVNGKIVFDDQIKQLTRMLFVGLVIGKYQIEWVKKWFYFDVRGFYFLVRTIYFSPQILAHFGGNPYKQFEPQQNRFEIFQGLGYGDFKESNREIDQAFIQLLMSLVSVKGTPILLTLAGPTAAGKTEIVGRLKDAFEKNKQKVTSIEMDSFLLDNDYRDDKGIKTLGKEAYHFELFLECMEGILHAKRVTIPSYEKSVSCYDENGKLKPGAHPIELEPADIIFLEGNFPFQIPEVSHFIGIKIVYLTDDPIRLKRKWKRDLDYRKKYEFNYFRNRYFRTQFLRAEDTYRPLMQECDLVVDTTNAALWATPPLQRILSK
jgi:uridine kinase